MTKEEMTMMKKEYIAPTIEVVEMEVVSMIAGSVFDGEQIGGGSGTTNDGDYGSSDEPEEWLSNRRRNYWKEVGKR